MLNLETIHKPTTLAEALELAHGQDVAILAGGTALTADRRKDVRAIVDLSALDLAYLHTQQDDIAIGATTTLAAVVDSSSLRELAGGVLGQAAHHSHANILRNQATVAGTIIAEPDGIFAVALSALDARITLAVLQNNTVVQETMSLADFFAQRETRLHSTIVTEITLPASSRRQRAALEFVGRTPRDRAIVSVCAALELERGIVRTGAVALGGVADTAWRARDAERELLHQGMTGDVIRRAAMAATSALHPRGDFRGSAEYRIEMVRVLTARALESVLVSL